MVELKYAVMGMCIFSTLLLIVQWLNWNAPITASLPDRYKALNRTMVELKLVMDSNKNVHFRPLNRTMVELKSSESWFLPVWPWPLNRTMVELKYKRVNKDGNDIPALNRTMVELKSWYERRSYKLWKHS